MKNEELDCFGSIVPDWIRSECREWEDSHSATFHNAGVAGFVRFTQDEGSTDVAIDVDLSGLQENAGGYHVHEFPVNSGGSGFTLNGHN